MASNRILLINEEIQKELSALRTDLTVAEGDTVIMNLNGGYQNGIQSYFTDQ